MSVLYTTPMQDKSTVYCTMSVFINQIKYSNITFYQYFQHESTNQEKSFNDISAENLEDDSMFEMSGSTYDDAEDNISVDYDTLSFQYDFSIYKKHLALLSTLLLTLFLFTCGRAERAEIHY